MLILVRDRGVSRTIIRCVPGEVREMEPEVPLETLKIAMTFAAAVSVLAAIARILDGQRKRLRRKRKTGAASIC